MYIDSFNQDQSCGRTWTVTGTVWSVNCAALGKHGRLFVLKILSWSFKCWVRTINIPNENTVSASLCNVRESAQIYSWESGIHQFKRKFDPCRIHNCSEIMHQITVKEYVNPWHAHIGRIMDTADGTGNKLSNYNIFKHSFVLEKYVLQMSLDDRRHFTNCGSVAMILTNSISLWYVHFITTKEISIKQSKITPLHVAYTHSRNKRYPDAVCQWRLGIF